MKLITLFSVFLLFCSPHQMQPDSLTSINNASKFADGGKHPVVVFLHGYGSNEQDLFSIADQLAPGFIVFSIRAPHVINESGYGWFNLDLQPGSQMRYDYGQATAASKQITAFIGHVKQRKDCDPDNVFILGFSQGAIMGYDVVLSNPGLVKGLVALSGGMMEETRRLKQADSGHVTKLFSGHGTQDDVIAVKDGRHAAQTLSARSDFKVTFKEYPAGHFLTDAEMLDIRNWFQSAR
jgi:phospholipase/carboxylesterase